jgi:ABC-type phosphate/phosphonate transport system substrate-binding protein
VALNSFAAATPMRIARIAALPMYDFPDLRLAHDALWGALRVQLEKRGVSDVPVFLARDLGHLEIWQHSGLLLAQGCEYPLAKLVGDRVRVIARPRYTAPGCEGANYRSALIVRDADPAITLADLRNRRCAVNEPSSNSGMNLLRAALAPVAAGRLFFEAVVLTGSHRRSVAAIASGEADVAAVDCVSWAYLQRLYPSEVAGLRILSWTPASPSLPFITSRNTDPVAIDALRATLGNVFADNALAHVRDQLLLEGVDLEADGGFTEVLSLEREAGELGYPVLG